MDKKQKRLFVDSLIALREAPGASPLPPELEGAVQMLVKVEIQHQAISDTDKLLKAILITRKSTPPKSSLPALRDFAANLGIPNADFDRQVKKYGGELDLQDLYKCAYPPARER